MSTKIASTHDSHLDWNIRRLLSGLRWRIRAYVWMEGLMVALVWVALAYWLTFFLDYSLVWIGATELPWQVRGVILAAIIGGAGFILYRWVLRRAFLPMGDRSMAVLLERQFLGFRDSLMTSVEMTDRPDHAGEFNPVMLENTYRQAVAQTGQVSIRRVFNIYPLLFSFLVAIAVVLPAAPFAMAFPDIARLSFERIFLLSDQPWERYHAIEVIGVEVSNPLARETLTGLPADATGVELLETQFLTFDEAKTVRVSKGSRVKLIVRTYDNKKLPDLCHVYYKSAEEFGHDDMSKLKGKKPTGDGDIEYEQHVFEDGPFSRVRSSISFSVVGGDHWQRGYTVEVVDSPVIAKTLLDCEFPSYMVDEENSLWLPRPGMPYTTSVQLPKGTRITVRAATNKPIKGATVIDAITRLPVETRIVRRVKVAAKGESADSSLPEVAVAFPAVQVTVDGAIKPSPMAIRGAVQLRDLKTGEILKVAVEKNRTFIVKGGKKLPVAAEGLKVEALVEGAPGYGAGGELTMIGSVNAETPDHPAPIIALLKADADHRPGFEFDVDSLGDHLHVTVVLHDVDDVKSREPEKIYIGSLADEPPKVEVLLRGIGPAVTPEVNMPIVGKINDDYGIAEAWVEIQPGEGEIVAVPFSVPKDGEIPYDAPDDEDENPKAVAIDFRELKMLETEPITLTPKDKLVVSIVAADRHDLEGGENIGRGDRYVIDVVTPDQLLALLENREAGLRRRFEQIIEEFEATRFSLVRVKSEDTGESRLDPGDLEPEEEKQSPAERLAELRQLLVQGAMRDKQKSAGEVLGVAENFDVIRLEIINNRLDSEDRKERLDEFVIGPLKRIGGPMFDEFQRRLDQLETDLDNPAKLASSTDNAIDQADAILLEMNTVLENLLKFETYNELLDIVRSLIEDQEDVIDGTKKERKKQLLEDLSN